jgi:hypothetical protein
MGLNERRIAKQAQDEWIPKTQSDLKEKIGMNVEIKVEWDTFQDTSSLEGLNSSAVNALVEALTGIAKDDMGKSALKKGLKRVVLKNSKADNTVTFDKGVLTLDETFGGGSYITSTTITDAIEPKL